MLLSFCQSDVLLYRRDKCTLFIRPSEDKTSQTVILYQHMIFHVVRDRV